MTTTAQTGAIYTVFKGVFGSLLAGRVCHFGLCQLSEIGLISIAHCLPPRVPTSLSFANSGNSGNYKRSTYAPQNTAKTVPGADWYLPYLVVGGRLVRSLFTPFCGVHVLEISHFALSQLSE